MSLAVHVAKTEYKTLLFEDEIKQEMTFFVLSRLQNNYMAANERNKTKKAFSLKGCVTNDKFYRLWTKHLKNA